MEDTAGRQSVLSLVVAGGAAVAFFVTVLHLHTLGPRNDVLGITDGHRIVAAGDVSATRSTASDPTALPSRWREDCPRCVEAWYGFDVSENLADRDQLLYIPHAGQRFAAYLNGEPLDSTHRKTNGLFRPNGGPTLIRLPPASASPTDELTLMLHADSAGRGFLGPLSIGGAESIADHYRLRYLLRTGVTQFALVFSIIVGLLLTALWAQRPEHRAYGWLAALALTFAFSMLPEAVAPGFAGTVTARWVEAAALALMAVSAARFASCYVRTGKAPPVWHLWVLAASLVALATIGFLAPTVFNGLWWPWQTTWLLAMLIGQVPLVIDAVGRRAKAVWPLFPTFLIILFAGRDAAVAAGIHRSMDETTLSFAAPVYIGAFAWLLLTRFIDTLRSTEAMNVELDRLVTEKTGQLEDQYQRMQAMQRERILAEERERIMRDMHDGVGGQLVSAMAMLERAPEQRAELRGALRGALTDMRLMIDSLEAVDEDLNAVLAMFRDRVQPLLSTAGLELAWRVDDLPPVPGLGPSSVLSILRVMQETVTNTIKHADAKKIVVTARQASESDGIEIRITDDGDGFEIDDLQGAGHGLRNIRKRALDHGFDLHIDSRPGAGTTVVMGFSTDHAV